MAYFQIPKPVFISGGTLGLIDKATFTYGLSLETPVGGVYQDTSPTLTAGQTGAFRVTSYRGLHVNLRTAGGVEILGTQLAAASIPVVLASDQPAISFTTTQLPATLGQKAMASSLAIAIASDQSAIPVSQSGTWNINDISGTISLPTGAASAANQATEIASLATIATNTTNAGTPVVSGTVTANQGGTWNINNISGTISLPTGAATEATLSTLNGKVTACNTGAVVVSSSALPSGAATLAKQPALGTAGTASADVITVQGIASMTPLRVTQTSGGSITDRSGSTSGTPSTSTQVAASNASRRYFFIENLDASNSIWINFTSSASAAAGSIKIVAGGSFVMEEGFVSTEAINVLAAVASVAFTAKEG